MLLSEIVALICRGANATFAAASIITGCTAVRDPSTFADTFGLELPPRSSGFNQFPKEAQTALLEQQNVTRKYVSLMGVRQLATGLILLTLEWRHQWREAAIVVAISGFVVATTNWPLCGRLRSKGCSSVACDSWTRFGYTELRDPASESVLMLTFKELLVDCWTLWR